MTPAPKAPRSAPVGREVHRRECPPGLGPPPRVEGNTSDDLRTHWEARLRQHVEDSYAGVSLCKFPEDLRTYEHLLWIAAPDTVIEVGTHHGGSALWFRDRLRALRDYRRIADTPRVVTIDLDQSAAESELAAADPGFAEQIELVEGDVTDPTLPERVASLLRPQASCFVVEDSGHTLRTTRAALEGFARFVPVGGFFVVEDGVVDFKELWPPDALPPEERLAEIGVLPAIDEWLQSPPGAKFAVRRDLELYGITCHPRGFLQRREAA